MQRKLASAHARRVISAVLAAAASCAGAGARAEAPPPAQPPQLPIVLVLDPCAVVDAREVRRLLPIEMGAPLAPGGGEGDTTRVFVGCVPGSPQLVRLEVRDAVTGRHVDRVITLVGDSKTDQARLVAIVAVELVATSRSELRERAPVAAPAPAAEPASLVVTAHAEATPRPAPLWRALAFGSVRHVAGLPSLLPGGGLALEYTLPRPFVLGADVVAEGAGQTTALGDVATFVASASAVAGVRLERGPWALQAGGGARGGVARFSGEARRSGAVPVTSSVFSAGWAGALFEARATATLAHGIVLLLGGELGYVTSPVEGYVSGHDAVAMRGLWWSAALGVGHAL